MFASGIGLAIYLGENVINPTVQWVGDKYTVYHKDERYDEIKTSVGEKPEPDKGLLDYVMGANNPTTDMII